MYLIVSILFKLSMAELIMLLKTVLRLTFNLTEPFPSPAPPPLPPGPDSPSTPLKDVSTHTRALKLKHQALEESLELCLLELRKLCLREAVRCSYLFRYIYIDIDIDIDMSSISRTWLNTFI